MRLTTTEDAFGYSNAKYTYGDTVVPFIHLKICKRDLQNREKERKCAFYIASNCHAFGSGPPVRPPTSTFATTSTP
jgi:hypothetical protein